MSMYVTIPGPATFIDAGSKKKAFIEDGNGVRIPMADRDHEWFMHVYILSHLQFSMEVGGGEASRAASEIGRSISKAVAEGASFYEVSNDNLLRIKCCYARATEADYNAVRNAAKPDPRILAKSSLGMARKLSNFEAISFQDQFDALDGASPKKPEVVATIAVGETADRPDSVSN